MHTQNSTIQTKYNYPLHEPYTIEDIFFFDIETTGFSPKTSYVYLIGGIYYRKGSWHLIQWLNEEPNKEAQLIVEFEAFIKSFKRIIHYNGSGFDIPFLQKKAESYGLADPFIKLESIDLYKLIQPLKRFLSLESLKLKSLEEYLKLKRKDTYSGEELIPVYSGYVGRLLYENMKIKSGELSAYTVSNQDTPDAQSLRDILLLHNGEDVINLLPISAMLYYCDTFKADFLTAFYTPLAYHLFVTDTFIVIEFKMPFIYPLPITTSCSIKEKGSLKKGLDYLEAMELKAEFIKDILKLHLPVYNGTLKYHLSPASDYFYLPLEDTAIHKSVAQYVDKEYRQKAKPANCYIKKQSRFIPVGEDYTGTCFKKNYSDRISYIEAENLEKQSLEEIITTVKGLINYMKEFFRI
ncbi:ribonuclease H-like domain-containing protein [Anaerocolumna sp. AGMB13020]|uniref:ribonuclease H-like domain-containing protein n=1 Tax=Anaerocolumna sp. AGMB13020 TaxID=3081750 RepID=UPI002954C6AE|nr:ribonuclease H-like domain-containing protein [Anaerocolumna sp. AGMB13020]WOO36388.1 ribonuclease H-like domain-containing protein [Anaerocolumna sp. AGMB13020]